MKNKLLRKFLIASVAVGTLTFAPEIFLPIESAVVHAEIREYVGVGESTVSDRETLEIGQEGAKLQAIRNAQEQAGVFISSLTVVKNHELEKDEITAFTAGIVKISDNVKYEPIPLGDNLGTIKYRATVTVSIETNELTDKINQWFKRSDRDRSNIVEQDKDLRQLVEQQAKRIKELEQTVAASKTQDKEKVRAEISKLDSDTKIIQKTVDGNRAYYNGDYSAAAKNFSDVLKLKEFDVEGFGISGWATGAQAKMLARRAAITDAYRKLAEHLREYVESRSPGLLKSNDVLRTQLNSVIKNAEITEEELYDDGTCRIKMRLQPEDVDKLKIYLESAR